MQWANYDRLCDSNCAHMLWLLARLYSASCSRVNTYFNRSVVSTYSGRREAHSASPVEFALRLHLQYFLLRNEGPSNSLAWRLSVNNLAVAIVPWLAVIFNTSPESGKGWLPSNSNFSFWGSSSGSLSCLTRSTALFL
jgi:hypothetical protein